MNRSGRDGDVQGPDQAPSPKGLPENAAELDALAALIGEEFAALLAPVLGNLTLLDEELPDGHPLRRRVAGLREAAAAARGFAQRLTLLNPKRKPSLQAMALDALVRDCLPAVRAQLRPEVSLEVTPAPMADLVLADAKQLEHALVELVRNGQEAMPGAGTLHIDMAVVDGGVGDLPAGRWAWLSVRDSGSGLEPAVATRAFEPGVTTKVPGGAAGLGLPIVAAIVRRHGGLVRVKSRPEGGTTGSIYLPILEGRPSAQSTTPSGTRVAATVDAGAAAGASVLLVEDNPMVRRAIEATLRIAGYRVTSVESGERCLETVGRLEAPLDLLISDVVMPEMSGEEMIDRVHELRPELPVLFISGYDRSTLARKKHAAAGEHFLQKPFDSEDLFAAVRKAMVARPGQRGG